MYMYIMFTFFVNTLTFVKSGVIRMRLQKRSEKNVELNKPTPQLQYNSRHTG